MKICTSLAKGVFTLFFLFMLAGKSNAQADQFVFENAAVGLKTTDLKLLKDAQIKFDQELYNEALVLFESISDKNQLYVNYLKGICYARDVDSKEKALAPIYALNDTVNAVKGYYFNLAYALARNDSMNKAIQYYEKALAIEEKKLIKNTLLIGEINLRIENCKNLINLKDLKNFVKVRSIGKPINSGADEYGPLIPSNEAMMIYTYRGPNSKGGKQKVKGSKIKNIDNVELYYEDVFCSKKINDTLWSEPKGVDNLNTNTHDAAVSLSPDGTELFIYRNVGKGNGDLYLSTLQGDNWSKPVIQLKLNSNEWDGSACFIPNEDKIIFSSERKGGFGGKDLYYAERIKENFWGNIKNLGPEINTKYDEDAPFITSDGEILFYASNNKNSIGGYDIFRCDLIGTELQSPYNVGAPINTDNDDKYFTVRADGKVAYYSSYKRGGDGGQDIYAVEPGIPGKPVQLLQIEGLITVDGRPSFASIDIKSVLHDKHLKFRVYSNKSTGSFLSNLPPGDEYELTVTVEPFTPKVIKLNTTKIDSFVVLNVYAEFNSDAYDHNVLKRNPFVKDSTLSNTSFDANSFSREMGDVKKPDLFYKVQIGAYLFPENFNYNNIMGFPKIIRQTDKDYITRFTMGNFKSYNEAMVLLNKVHANNLKGAFITAVYQGERKLLYQLLEEKIIVKE